MTQTSAPQTALSGDSFALDVLSSVGVLKGFCIAESSVLLQGHLECQRGEAKGSEANGPALWPAAGLGFSHLLSYVRRNKDRRSILAPKAPPFRLRTLNGHTSDRMVKW